MHIEESKLNDQRKKYALKNGDVFTTNNDRLPGTYQVLSLHRVGGNGSVDTYVLALNEAGKTDHFSTKNVDQIIPRDTAPKRKGKPAVATTCYTSTGNPVKRTGVVWVGTRSALITQAAIDLGLSSSTFLDHCKTYEMFQKCPGIKAIDESKMYEPTFTVNKFKLKKWLRKNWTRLLETMKEAWLVYEIEIMYDYDDYYDDSREAEYYSRGW